MKCPFCSHLEDKVIDSRLSQDGSVTRRRRECLQCSKRFTSYERVEEMMPLVVKKDGMRVVYDRDKIMTGLKKACEKRAVSSDDIDSAIDRIETTLAGLGEKEVESRLIGEAVMDELRALDEVAYVRFASVYRDFRDIKEFMSELTELIDIKKKTR